MGIKQIDQMYFILQVAVNAPDQPIDYRNYRTLISLTGGKKDQDYLQKQIPSHGWSTEWLAYMLTGKDLYLEAAEKGTEYLRDK